MSTPTPKPPRPSPLPLSFADYRPYFLTSREAAARLHCSPRALHRLIRLGRIPEALVVRLAARRCLFLRRAFVRWAKCQTFELLQTTYDFTPRPPKEDPQP